MGNPMHMPRLAPDPAMNPNVPIIGMKVQPLVCECECEVFQAIPLMRIAKRGNEVAHQQVGFQYFCAKCGKPGMLNQKPKEPDTDAHHVQGTPPAGDASGAGV